MYVANIKKIKFRSCAIGHHWSGIFNFPLTNSFNKFEAAIFPMHAMLPYDFPFSQVNLTADVKR